MAEVNPESSPPQSLKEVIERFITGRQLKRLEKFTKEVDDESLPPDEDDLKNVAGNCAEHADLDLERADILAGNRIHEWVEDAARRAGWLTMVSHAVKFGNPDASGTELLFAATTAVPDTYVGTHSLGCCREDDVVGNAAALDVYSFLKLTYAGKSVLQHASEESSELLHAIGGDEDVTRRWLRDLASVLVDDQPPSSHPLSKQVFFPVSEHNNYHLLAPLFPTSLVHSVWKRMQKDLFGDGVKDAREARKAGIFCNHGFVDYPDLAIQTFGGSKPQNISQLNSERGGKAWLIPSFPPTWRRRSVRPPLYVESVFVKGVIGAPRVDELIANLADFLVKVSDYNNVNIRKATADMVAQVIDEVLMFGIERQETLEPGWSAGTDCRLVECERLWLDPGRAASDSDFASKLEAGDWHHELATRFAAWFNAQLRRHSSKKKELTVGECEQLEWAQMMREALRIENWGVNHG